MTTLAVPYPATRTFRRGERVRLLPGAYERAYPPHARIDLDAEAVGAVVGWRNDQWRDGEPESVVVYVAVAGW